jgi:hypothetical protein
MRAPAPPQKFATAQQQQQQQQQNLGCCAFESVFKTTTKAKTTTRAMQNKSAAHQNRAHSQP